MAALVSRGPLSMPFVIAVGLATTVEFTVAVGAVLLPRLARLVTLAGLVSAFSSDRIGLGIEIEFATVDSASLMVVAALGASCGRLIPAPAPPVSEASAL